MNKDEKMKTTEDVLNINTIEQLTLHSLDRSLEGLEQLRSDCIHCGEALLNNLGNGLNQIMNVAQNLHTFCVFEGDICSLFQVDTDRIRDGKGTLKNVETKFNSTLVTLVTRLESHDFTGLADVLRIDLPMQIDRFQDLMPSLRNYIDNEYIQTLP
jgi:hypothetical protein